MRITKANDQQKAEYNARRPVYPLYGFVDAKAEGEDGKTRVKLTCAIEYVGDRDNQIIYEVMAPDGYHFDPEHLHTMLCSSRDDIRSRVTGNVLVKCNDNCR